MVQPGVTRSMQPYDTCCKACAMSKGGGRHDANCEGGGETAPIRVCVPSVNPRNYLESLLTSEKLMFSIVQQAVPAAQPDAPSVSPEEALAVLKGLEEKL